MIRVSTGAAGLSKLSRALAKAENRTIGTLTK